MNDSRIDAPLNAHLKGAGTDTRRVLNSQSQRHRWEAAWLDQQRGAFDVIEYEHGDAQTAESTRAAPINNEPSAERISGQGDGAMTRAHRLLQENSHASTGANVLSPATTDSAHGLFQQLPTMATLKSPLYQISGRQISDGEASKTESSAASASSMSRAMPPSSALWLEGESVRSAMRLKDPVRTGETLAALREWLRDAGLWLREAWVNGRIVFKSGRDHGN